MTPSIVVVSSEPPPEGLQVNEPRDFSIHWYVCLSPDDPDDYQDVLDLCRRKRAVGILAGAAPQLPLVAWVSEALGLVGVSVQLAQSLNDRALLLERLRASGVPTIPFRVATTEEEAVRAAQALGEPVVVQAVEGTEGARSRYVQHLPEAGLGYRQVTRHTGSKRVLITHPVTATRHSVYFYVHKGAVTQALLLDVTIEPRFMYPVALSAPGHLHQDGAPPLVDLGQRVVEAVRFATGVLRIDILETPIGPQVAAADMCPLSGWMPCDLGRLTGSTDIYGAALRLAAGKTPPPVNPPEQAAAIAWLNASSGEVTAIEGEAEAEALDGVEAVFVRAAPCDIIRHIVDQAGRDTLGFVVTTGPDLETAEQRASAAASTVAIRTRTAYADATEQAQ